MAITATHTTFSRQAGSALRGFGAGVVGVVSSFAAARRAAAELQRLNTLTDAELARDGLTRETLVNRAFDRYLAH